MSCVAELVQLRDEAERFDRRGLALAAMGVDPPEKSLSLVSGKGLPFPVLSDPDLVLLDRIGLRHPQGHAGKDIARPASILFDATGLVRWTFQGVTTHDRVAVEDVLAAADERLAGSAGSA